MKVIACSHCSEFSIQALSNSFYYGVIDCLEIAVLVCVKLRFCSQWWRVVLKILQAQAQARQEINRPCCRSTRAWATATSLREAMEATATCFEATVWWYEWYEGRQVGGDASTRGAPPSGCAVQRGLGFMSCVTESLCFLLRFLKASILFFHIPRCYRLLKSQTTQA